MKSLFHSVVFGFAVVSVLGATSASASPKVNAVVELASNSLDGELSVRDLTKAGVVFGAVVGGAIIAGTAGVVAWGFNALFLDED